MSTKAKSQPKEVASQPAAATEASAALMLAPVLTEQKPTRAYLIDKVDEASGEVT